jgi:NAD(P)-dependent dehydrogenase (short-subunit alcohol dehydrogenase family)
MRDLAGRVAVVTGGASGIGRGMALTFAARAMKLVIADVEEEALHQSVADLAQRGADVHGVHCDVADPAAVEALRDETLTRFGAVHVVCNNAGVAGGSSGATWEAPLEDWSWVLGVNLMGVVHGVRSFIPAMLAQGGPGHVVNTASMAGLIPGMGIYGVSKHAVVALSESLSIELGALGHPIGVSVLCPGWVRTRIVEAERNRPEAPRPSPGERAAEYEARRAVIAALVAQGLDPLDVGRLVADSIEQGRFYVLPHPHWKNMVEHRLRGILDGRPPSVVGPDSPTEWSGELD